jgi:hypothetical protein
VKALTQSLLSKFSTISLHGVDMFVVRTSNNLLHQSMLKKEECLFELLKGILLQSGRNGNLNKTQPRILLEKECLCLCKLCKICDATIEQVIQMQRMHKEVQRKN